MFGALVNAASSVFGNIMQNRNAKAQRQFEREENQKTREYNLELAKQQNTWNIEQWNRENAYNSPLQQRQRYAEAGLNPDLIYGQQNLSASSPQLTSGAPGTPTPSDSFNNLPTWGNVGQSALAGLEASARIKNINADTENKEADTDKKGEETKGLSIDNITRALKNGTEIEEAGVRIRFGESNIELNNERKKEIQKNCEVLAQNVANLREELELTRAEVDLKRDLLNTQKMDRLISQMRLFLDSEKCSAEISYIQEQTKLTKEQVISAVIHNSADKLRLPLEREKLRLDVAERAAYEKHFGSFADNAMKRDSAITYSTVEEHNAKGKDYEFWNKNKYTSFLYTVTQHWRSLIGAIKH